MKNNNDLPLIATLSVVIVLIIAGAIYTFLLYQPNKNQNTNTSSEVEPTRVLTETEKKALDLLSTDLANGYNPDAENSANEFKLEINKTVTFSKETEIKTITGKTLPNAEIIITDDDQEEIETVKANDQGDFEYNIDETIEGTYLLYFRSFQNDKSSELKAVEVAIN